MASVSKTGRIASPAPDRPLVHFVGFRDDRYWNAVRIWGEPDFIHITWDRYAAQDIAPGDTVVFANGDWTQEPKSFGGPDIVEAEPPPS